MRICKKCKIEKDISEYYVFDKERGYISWTCHRCVIENNKTKKYNRSNDVSIIHTRKYVSKFPEKIKARNASWMLKSINKENHMHHWSYNEEHYKDVIEMNRIFHRNIHRFIVYDQSKFMYRTKETGYLLDTKEKHIKYIYSLKFDLLIEDKLTPFILKLSDTQKLILNTLKNGGKLFLFDDGCVGLDKCNGDSINIRKSSIKRLLHFNYIEYAYNCSINTKLYTISSIGELCLKDNKNIEI